MIYFGKDKKQITALKATPKTTKEKFLLRRFFVSFILTQRAKHQRFKRPVSKKNGSPQLLINKYVFYYRFCRGKKTSIYAYKCIYL